MRSGLRGNFTYLVGRKAHLAINSHLEDRVGLLETNDRRTAQITVRIVAMAKRQAVHVPVALVVCCAIVKETPNATTLITSQSARDWIS